MPPDSVRDTKKLKMFTTSLSLLEITAFVVFLLRYLPKSQSFCYIRGEVRHAAMALHFDINRVQRHRHQLG